MRRSETIREYAAASLWVRPTFASAAALVAGAALSQVRVPEGSALARLAFQGTADDARTMLIGITGTVVTVIALVLGLTVVALQLSSTQFSPRLLRNFLRDRPNQIVLSIFMATFAYSAAGLFTVGVAGGGRSAEFPRIAVSGSLVLLFVSLGMVVFFADHLAHSIQIDAIMRAVERGTLEVVRPRSDGAFHTSGRASGLASGRASGPTSGPTSGPGPGSRRAPQPPPWAVPVLARASGYVQTAHPEDLVALADRTGSTVRLRVRVGEHVVAGTVLAWAWTPSAADPAPDAAQVADAVHDAVRLGFERTLEQDAGLGIRQLADIACKALSPAVNDPYTAVQAIDHLTVVLVVLARAPLGPQVLEAPAGRGAVVMPASRFDTYLGVPCGLIRRYGAGEPTVSLALLRMLAACGGAVGPRSPRWAAIEREAGLVLADAEQSVRQPADLVLLREKAASLRRSAAALAGNPDGWPDEG